MQPPTPEANPWEIVFMGQIMCIEVIKAKGFERAVRAPGVRLVLRNQQGLILLTKEFRHEQGRADYRLPGGKVFDDLASYLAVRNNEATLMGAAINAAYEEAKQEAGIDEITNLEHICTSKNGATSVWDLYYFRGTIVSMGEQDLAGDEVDGIEVGFYTEEQVLQMLKSREILEDRSRAVLYDEVVQK